MIKKILVSLLVFDLFGKKVFMWVDFNVFVDYGSIIDDIWIWVVIFII